MYEMKLLMRAEAYRKTMVPRADVEQPYPMWYGWVINEAWLAGYAAAQAAALAMRERCAQACEQVRDKSSGTATECIAAVRRVPL